MERLHRLAVRSVNVLLRLHALPDFFDGERHARGALLELREVVGRVPPLPLKDDPFASDAPVEIAGEHATSVHGAALALARRTWEALQSISLRLHRTADGTDDGGNRYRRVTQALVRHAPTELGWTPEVWRQVCARLRDCPVPDPARFEAALATERCRAGRRPVPRPAVRGKRKVARVRDRGLDGRDRWLYRLCCRGVAYKKIQAELKTRCPGRRWRPLASVQGIRAAASGYAARNRLPPIPRRQDR